MTTADPPAAEGRFSLQGLSAAFARLTGAENSAAAPPAIAAALDELQAPSTAPASDVLSPRMLVEGMLFVGHSDGQPLTNRDLAANLRNVSPAEIDALIEELNALYQEVGAPYEIVSAGAGYRLQIRPAFDTVRQRFYGSVREAKLTPQAMEVLSVVAYRQPITAEQVTQLRRARSRTLLNNLVRRGLLRIERPAATPRQPTYLTTDRFNHLFGIKSAADLPRSEDLDDA